MAQTLKEELKTYTVPGSLYQTERDGVRCYACGHRCFIPEGHDGICKVRRNEKGVLKVPWGYVAGIQLDPIEKKPFFHVLPGQPTLSFGMLGCDLRCAYCQNWMTSQTLRDDSATARPVRTSSEELVSMAARGGVPVLTSTYNEPLITSEWAIEIFKQARKKGIRGAYVSNGNATKEVLDYIRPYVDFYKIDLKSFRDKPYRQLGGVLKNITDSIEMVFKFGFWLEVVTLLVPGLNDDPSEIKDLTAFLAKVSPDIPWHVTAFHSDYKMGTLEHTAVESVCRAAETGKAAGLRYVYAGNLPGKVEGWEDTVCPGCHGVVIKRRGFRVLENGILENGIKDGKCPQCARVIPGVWQ